jgi:hypothetical protein
VVVRRTAGTALRAAAALALALAAAGCSSAASTAPQVSVLFGGDKLALDATQYCAGGTGHRYQVRPPVVTAAPDTRITFTVPDAVAAQGWSVQVFDQQLEERLGTVAVDKGTAVFAGITTSDVAPAAYYLVVVENKGSGCDNLSGAWPVGVIRTAAAGSSSAGSSSAGSSSAGSSSAAASG